MKLNQAISERLSELLKEKQMTQYQLFMKSGVPKSTIGNVINCSYDSVKLRIVHEMCQGLELIFLSSLIHRCLRKAILIHKCSSAACVGTFLTVSNYHHNDYLSIWGYLALSL